MKAQARVMDILAKLAAEQESLYIVNDINRNKAPISAGNREIYICAIGNRCFSVYSVNRVVYTLIVDMGVLRLLIFNSCAGIRLVSPNGEFLSNENNSIAFSVKTFLTFSGWLRYFWKLFSSNFSFIVSAVALLTNLCDESI